MLKLGAQEGRVIRVTGEHPVFEGTEYAGQDFAFVCRPVSATKLAELQKRHLSTVGAKAVVHADTIGIVRDTFLFVVTSWEGICDESGNPLACDTANKCFVFDYYTELAGLVIQAVTETSRGLDKQREDTLGKS